MYSNFICNNVIATTEITNPITNGLNLNLPKSYNMEIGISLGLLVILFVLLSSHLLFQLNLSVKDNKGNNMLWASWKISFRSLFKNISLDQDGQSIDMKNVLLFGEKQHKFLLANTISIMLSLVLLITMLFVKNNYFVYGSLVIVVITLLFLITISFTKSLKSFKNLSTNETYRIIDGSKRQDSGTSVPVNTQDKLLYGLFVLMVVTAAGGLNYEMYSILSTLKSNEQLSSNNTTTNTTENQTTTKNNNNDSSVNNATIA